VQVVGHFQIVVLEPRQDDDRTLVEFELGLLGQRSGLTGQTTLVHVLRIDAGRVKEVWVYRDRAEAVEAMARAGPPGEN
jgi:hypothetical protein